MVTANEAKHQPTFKLVLMKDSLTGYELKDETRRIMFAEKELVTPRTAGTGFREGVLPLKNTWVVEGVYIAPLINHRYKGDDESFLCECLGKSHTTGYTNYSIHKKNHKGIYYRSNLLGDWEDCQRNNTTLTWLRFSNFNENLSIVASPFKTARPLEKKPGETPLDEEMARWRNKEEEWPVIRQRVADCMNMQEYKFFFQGKTYREMPMRGSWIKMTLSVPRTKYIGTSLEDKVFKRQDGWSVATPVNSTPNPIDLPPAEPPAVKSITG